MCPPGYHLWLKKKKNHLTCEPQDFSFFNQQYLTELYYDHEIAFT